MKSLWLAVRSFLLGAFLVLLSLGLFYLFAYNRGARSDPLVKTLERVGRKAVSVVRNPQERKQLEAEYGRFVELVRSHQLEPADVLKIAARTLNLAYADSEASGHRVRELRRSLVVVTNGPRKTPPKADSRFAQRQWQRVERRVRAAQVVMARLQHTRPGDAGLAVPVQFDSTLRPQLDSAALQKLRALEDKTRQLEAMRLEQLQELERKRRKLDSLLTLTQDSLARAADSLKAHE